MFEKENKPFLVAAGDPDINTLLQLVLQFGGHNVITADNGLEILNILDNYPKNQWVALLINPNLPKLSGVEVARKIRQDEINNPIPMLIAFISNEDNLGQKIPDLASLAQGIIRINRPINIQEILAAAGLFANLSRA